MSNIMHQPGNIEVTGEKILEETLRKGVEQAEIFLTEVHSTSIEVKEQKVDAFQVSSSIGVSLRILKNQKMGFAYTSIINPEGIKPLIRDALDNALFNDPDPFVSFSEKVNISTDLDIFDDKIRKITESEKINVAKQIEKNALDYDKRIVKVRSASYHDSETKVYLLNSRDVSLSWSGTVCSTGITIMARQDGNSETGYDSDYSRFYDLLKKKEIGINAAKKAVSMLGARQISSCNIPIVFDQNVACDFISVLSSSLLADSVQKGKSMLAGKIGSEVAAPGINLIDNGLLKKGIKSSPADHEGSPGRSTTIIEKGALKGFLHNIYTARKENTASTGNGLRRGFKMPPSVGVTNLFIENGPLSEEKLIGEIDKGLYITDAMGVHTADPISGDFSIGAAGFRIEGGKKAFPVRGIAIAGNILDLFKNIDGIGNNLRFFGGIGSPSLRVSNMVVSGE